MAVMWHLFLREFMVRQRDIEKISAVQDPSQKHQKESAGLDVFSTEN